MNCCDTYGNCTQGRNCPVRKERELSMKNRSVFWEVIEGLVSLSVLVGLIASMCFLFGYIWYRA
jgi:hypothetical protein